MTLFYHLAFLYVLYWDKYFVDNAIFPLVFHDYYRVVYCQAFCNAIYRNILWLFR